MPLILYTHMKLIRLFSTDVRVLLDDEPLLESGATGFFEDYNLEQFVTVTPPGKKYPVGNGFLASRLRIM